MMLNQEITENLSFFDNTENVNNKWPRALPIILYGQTDAAQQAVMSSGDPVSGKGAGW